MSLEIKGTNVLRKNLNTTNRFIVNQGGARSSKTYSILQKLILHGLQSKEKLLFTISRKTLPALRDSAQKDFFDILRSYNIYNHKNFELQTRTYTLRNAQYQFLSVDNPEKKKGRKQDYTFLNEANEFTYDDFFALNIRTNCQVILDYNPNFQFSWIYDQIIPRSDCTFIKSTYLDNPFIDKGVKEELERTRELNPAYFKVFGLGDRGELESLVLTNYRTIDLIPGNFTKCIIGIDFGFNSPTAIVRCLELSENNWFVELLSYKQKLDNDLLIKELENLNINKNNFIFTDHNPEKVEILRRNGYNIYEANKDVLGGIDFLKTCRLNIYQQSTDLIKELQCYCWKKLRDGRIIDEPIKLNDHAIDAMRYAIYTYTTRFKARRKNLIVNF